MKKVKIICAVDDSCPIRPFIATHGLSIVVEYGKKKILFDAGRSSAILGFNLKVLGYDPLVFDAFVLSHGHDDHGEGYLDLSKSCADVIFYCSNSAFDPFFYNTTKNHRYLDGGKRERIDIGIASRKVIKSNFNDIRFVEDIVEIFPGAYLSCFEGHNIKEVSLFLEHEKGIVVVTGCCHQGLESLLGFVKDFFKEKDLYALVGGLHLLNKDEKQLKKVIRLLKESGVRWIAPNHCTGFAGLKALHDAFPEKIVCSKTGSFSIGEEFEI